MKSHVKMLAGNFLTYKKRSEQSGGSARCRLGCKTPSGQEVEETLSHVVGGCLATADTRGRILREMPSLMTQSQQSVKIDFTNSNEELITQFILDPSSLNLTSRININDPILPEMFRLSRDICTAIDKQRREMLNCLS